MYCANSLSQLRCRYAMKKREIEVSKGEIEICAYNDKNLKISANVGDLAARVCGITRQYVVILYSMW